jgi:hypothetical protein
MARHAELAAGLEDEAVADGHFFEAGGRAGEGAAELFFGGAFFKHAGEYRSIREYGDDVVGDLHETAVDVVTDQLVLVAHAKFAVAEAADERGAAGGDADFAVVQRQGNEIGGRFQRGRLWGDDDAVERAGRGGGVGHGLRNCSVGGVSDADWVLLFEA